MFNGLNTYIYIYIFNAINLYYIEIFDDTKRYTDIFNDMKNNTDIAADIKTIPVTPVSSRHIYTPHKTF